MRRVLLLVVLVAGTLGAVAIACNPFGGTTEVADVDAADVAPSADAAPAVGDASAPTDGGDACTTLALDFSGTFPPALFEERVTAPVNPPVDAPSIPPIAQSSDGGHLTEGGMLEATSTGGSVAFLERKFAVPSATRVRLDFSIDLVTSIPKYAVLGCYVELIGSAQTLTFRTSADSAHFSVEALPMLKDGGGAGDLERTFLFKPTPGWHRLSLELSTTSAAPTPSVLFDGEPAQLPPVALTPPIDRLWLRCGVMEIASNDERATIRIDDVHLTLCTR